MVNNSLLIYAALFKKSLDDCMLNFYGLPLMRIEAIGKYLNEQKFPSDYPVCSSDDYLYGSDVVICLDKL